MKVGASIAFSLLIVGQVVGKSKKHGKKRGSVSESVEEDAKLTFEGLARKYGYPSESHSVQTQDGYILKLHRIPYKKSCRHRHRLRPPVLVFHGLLCSSIDWIIMGPKKSLGYILADECYDVWLGNSRGNTESKKHVALSPSDRRFWNFSWHEMGQYDLPAIVSYIEKETGRRDMHYIGHSQGTTQFFIFSSMYPEKAANIRSMQALAPVAFMGNLRRPVIQALSFFHSPLETLSKIVGLYEFLPRSEFLVRLGSEVCKDKYPKIQKVCTNILFLMCGYDSEQLNTTMLPAILGHTPAGSSTRQFIHYAQSVTSGKFRQYDYGPVENFYKHYKSIYPPDYEIGKIRVPIVLYHSENDMLVDSRDVIRLERDIPTVIEAYKVPHKRFNHLDYMYANDAATLLYDKVLEVLKAH